MGLLVAWLSIETQREDAHERRERQRGYPIPSRRRPERKYLCIYAAVSAFFALSYIGRFINNEFFFCGSNADAFVAEMVYLACWFFEGVSMGALMCVHMSTIRPKSKRKIRPSAIKK